MEKTERGFTIYGRVTDGRGNVATVQESSAVGGPYAWVFVRDAEGRDVTFHRPTGSHVPATMHLDAAQARALARLLQAFAGDRDAGEEAWLRGELAGLARRVFLVPDAPADVVLRTLSARLDGDDRRARELHEVKAQRDMLANAVLAYLKGAGAPRGAPPAATAAPTAGAPPAPTCGGAGEPLLRRPRHEGDRRGSGPRRRGLGGVHRAGARGDGPPARAPRRPRRARLLPRGVRPHGARGGGRDALVRARVDFPLTPNHCCIHPCLRVAEVRAEGATPVPEGYVALGAEALARRLGVHRVTAWRRMERLKAVQRSDPDALRVVELPVAIGSGARRLALHVLWPVSDAA